MPTAKKKAAVVLREMYRQEGELDLAYRPGIDAAPDGRARAFHDRLLDGRRVELKAGRTLWGPHMDDLAIALGGNDLASFGSSGQKRKILFVLKLAKAGLIMEETGEAPTLLVDDLDAELDSDNIGRLISCMAGSFQVLVSTSKSEVALSLPAPADLLHVEKGTARKMAAPLPGERP